MGRSRSTPEDNAHASTRHVFLDRPLDSSSQSSLPIRPIRNALRDLCQLRYHLVLEKELGLANAELIEREMRKLAQTCACNGRETAQRDGVGGDRAPLAQTARRFAQRPYGRHRDHERPWRMLVPRLDDTASSKRAQETRNRFAHNGFPIPAVDPASRDDQELLGLRDLSLAQPRFATRLSLLRTRQGGAQIQSSFAPKPRLVQGAMQRDDALAFPAALATPPHITLALAKRVPEHAPVERLQRYDRSCPGQRRRHVHHARRPRAAPRRERRTVQNHGNVGIVVARRSVLCDA